MGKEAKAERANKWRNDGILHRMRTESMMRLKGRKTKIETESLIFLIQYTMKRSLWFAAVLVAGGGAKERMLLL